MDTMHTSTDVDDCERCHIMKAELTANDLLAVQTIELPGLHGWHWEVAITYADVLADIVLHASSSSIVKVALMGNNSDDSTELDRATNVSRCPMPSAGLLDLIYFRAVDENNDGGTQPHVQTV